MKSTWSHCPRNSGNGACKAPPSVLPACSQSKPDLILASSMIDLSIFRALTYRQSGRCADPRLYFHENQLSYPQNRRQGHGWRYGFINFVSALTADGNYFNSAFHLRDFMEQLPRLLKHFPDFNELHSIESYPRQITGLATWHRVAPSSINSRSRPSETARPLSFGTIAGKRTKIPRLLYKACCSLPATGFDFRVAITGERFGEMSGAFQKSASATARSSRSVSTD